MWHGEAMSSSSDEPSFAPDVEAFWSRAREHLHLNPAPVYFGTSPLEVLRPDAWAFGATPAQADELLELVLQGTKTATSSAYWDYEAGDEALPEVGAVSIVLDGTGRPRAVVATTEVLVMPFDEVEADHAAAEGEGDLSLTYWRAEHERFFTEHRLHDRGFTPQMPVVLERFELLYRE